MRNGREEFGIPNPLQVATGKGRRRGSRGPAEYAGQLEKEMPVEKKRTGILSLPASRSVAGFGPQISFLLAAVAERGFGAWSKKRGGRPRGTVFPKPFVSRSNSEGKVRGREERRESSGIRRMKVTESQRKGS
ncbi:MAG: hypothetical protein D6679_12255 [Candidatus Hydrogenedentota bacterium]|nr:MAG: hypothetical protein D6679_12255 [Candidatus Hydrogenedentota bacterium]